VAGRSGWTVPVLADAYLGAGARFIQVRSKLAASAVLLAMCQEVVALARPYGAVVVVNDRADIAKLAGADGVHVGQDDLDPASVRRILGAHALVGLSTHSLEQVRAAAAEPASYIAVGPVFGTGTKDTGYAEVGTALIGKAAALLRTLGASQPVVAIGGITLERAPDVIRAGATSVAVISDLLSTGHPAERVREYLRVLGETSGPA
jgi:thiamine-phosphate pyrophosphorylase